MERSPGHGLSDAQRALARLKVGLIQQKIEIAHTKLRGLDPYDDQSIALTKEVMALKAELQTQSAG